jgi:peptidoglycan/xylan/chitin deacetylase (PgdA/CDA1 family)
MKSNAEERPIISLTFDDGWLNQYEFAMPILSKYNIKATFYIITQHLYSKSSKYMGSSEVLDLKQQMHEIGAHSVTHPDLTIEKVNVKYEVERSKSDIEVLGIDAESFAYPYGRYNAHTTSNVQKAGFLCARIIGDAFNKFPLNMFEIQGMMVRETTTVSEIMRWLEIAVTNNGWPTLIFHDIQLRPNEYGTTPTRLDRICNEIVLRGYMCSPLAKVARNRYSDAMNLATHPNYNSWPN